ncbi:hypothetical protein A2634_03935 [Candidatus Amesbacteria bacterium RIFCSPHIGHO2_01_FULL_48_32]|uniref:Glycosyltransferase 2-like domain-containing protein n=1 Tax=Candidatus Amesbacteria bacterium RIFCSPLOWO2_01_FULL_48_25 TaxID=1797259 RepID=A0A1F4ZDN1_9BACT|nr:MAG: hypothetical protein A2634_03935 [Candidatus Amesbacteria bacterium RIFCSPHIGHO2_01_FULL_48_32]OGD03504.1 MAG: hypothetical protein A2989_02665 [Candidatus Amesbacteria bacterium RIFCSPLOWO2_01_FULL_48_25]HJZ05814.1 glycosyltransferase [Patescibacteria group bacterium]
MAKIALVITVYNENRTIDSLLASLKSQTLQPSETIIVDGGSSDSTYSKLQSYSKSYLKLKVFQKPGNRSVGRNYAVSKATSPIIAFTDAGCIPEPNWLEELIKPFSNSQVKIVSGYYKGLPENPFQEALVPYVLVMPDKVQKQEFFPATRSMAIRKEVFITAGGFDPNLSHNEDYAYAHKLKKMGYNFTFAPHAVVGWIPRKNLIKAAKMFFRFALGDIQSKIIRPTVITLFARYILFLFFPFIFPLYLFWPILKNSRYVHSVKAILWLPAIQFTADISVMIGTLYGLL